MDPFPCHAVQVGSLQKLGTVRMKSHEIKAVIIAEDQNHITRLTTTQLGSFPDFAGSSKMKSREKWKHEKQKRTTRDGT